MDEVNFALMSEAEQDLYYLALAKQAVLDGLHSSSLEQTHHALTVVQDYLFYLGPRMASEAGLE